MALSTEEVSLATITIVSACLSVSGGVALMLTYHKVPEFRTSVTKLLVFLTIADIFTASGNIIGTVNYLRLDTNQTNSTDPVCVAQSFITTFSSLSSFAWTSIIAVHLYLLIRKQRNPSLKYFYHFMGWIVPAIICLPILASGKLGRDNHGDHTGTGLWCWIRIDYIDGKIHLHDILLMFMSGKLWELLTYVLSFSLYMLLKIDTYIKRQRYQNYRWSDVDGADLRDEDERFCFMWLVLYLLRFWGTISFFIVISNYTKSNTLNTANDILKYLHGAGDSAQALGNFILICVLDKKIRQKYRDKMKECCHRRQSYNKISDS